MQRSTDQFPQTSKQVCVLMFELQRVVLSTLLVKLHAIVSLSSVTHVGSS